MPCVAVYSSQSSTLAPGSCRCSCSREKSRGSVKGWGRGPPVGRPCRGAWGGEPRGPRGQIRGFSLEVLPRGVSQAVPPQITVSPEHFAALLAAVGLDVCMGEKVSFQITSLIKGSSTCGAFVWRFLFRCEASKGLILPTATAAPFNSSCPIGLFKLLT